MIKDTKYLGVYVDQHLSWDVQIANMVKKISKALGMLRYSKQYLPIKSVQTMYESLVELYFRYCCLVRGSTELRPALDKLQKLQNLAARIVTNSPYNAYALPIIRELGWQTVDDLIVEETLKMVYKCTNDEAPSYLACLSAGYQKPVSGNCEIPKPIYVSCFYEQHVVKNAFLVEGRNYGMGLMQHQN